MLNIEELKKLLDKAVMVMPDKSVQSTDCILVFLFFKYISDVFEGHKASFIAEFKDDERAINGRINRLVLRFPKESLFSYFCDNVENQNIVKIVKDGMALYKNKEKNREWLLSIFSAINIDSIVDKYLDTLDEEVIRKLIKLFGSYSMAGKEEYDVFGTAFEYLKEWRYSFRSFRDYVGM